MANNYGNNRDLTQLKLDMMKLKFYTIKIEGKCYDLPKDMPIPQIGSVVFVDNEAGVVDRIHYHVVRGKIHMISIFTIP